MLVSCVAGKGVWAMGPDPAPPAAAPPLVVLIGATGDEPLLGRIAAELRSLGIDIDQRLVSPEDHDLELLVETVLHEGARAAVRVQARVGRIEVSISDPATREVALREVLEGSPTAAAEPILAVRSVEFVRAMLLGTAGASAGTAPEGGLVGPPPSEHTPELAAASPVLGLTLASGVAAAAGGLGAQAEIGGEIRIGLGRLLGIDLLGLAPLTTEAVPGAAAANARASVWLAGGGLYAHRSAGRAGSVELGAGALAVGLRVAGNPGPMWSGTAKMRVGTAAYGRLGGALGLTRMLAARADLLVGSVFQRPVAYAGGPGYPWGHVFATALLGIEARWF